jgi:hypothetical protein
LQDFALLGVLIILIVFHLLIELLLAELFFLVGVQLLLGVLTDQKFYKNFAFTLIESEMLSFIILNNYSINSFLEDS